MERAHQETRIGRLQLHTGKRDVVATQVGLRQSLHQVRLHPSQLPTSAILIIRRLHQLPSYPRHVAAARCWNQQLQNRIAELARRAARPRHQPGARDAESVLFMDASDMLVCYAHDVMAHRLPWYWHELFPLLPTHTVGAQLMAAWCAYPQALPAALVQLQPVAAAQAVATLTPPQLLRLTHLLHRTFNLSERVLLALVEDKRPSQPQIDGTRTSQLGASPPWRTWLPSQVAAPLMPLADYALGLCYGLVNRPQFVRTEPFTFQTVRWLRTVSLHHLTNDAAEVALATRAEISADPLLDNRLEDVSVARRAGGDRATERAPGVRPPYPPSSVTMPSIPLSSEIEALETAGSPVIPVDPTSADQVSALPADRDPASVVTGTDQIARIATRLGGAFYLVNLLTRLPLPWGIEKLARLNPWELLGAMTADLLGDRLFDYLGDPLWGLLRELAHLDPDEQWGATMIQPDRFVAPPLAALSAEASAQTAPALAWWLIRSRPLMHYLLKCTFSNPVRRVETLLATPATLVVTHTHIDVHMPLDAIDIDMRRAGLDRDPGWVPEFGYIVTFHFHAEDGHWTAATL